MCEEQACVCVCVCACVRACVCVGNLCVCVCVCVGCTMACHGYICEIVHVQSPQRDNSCVEWQVRGTVC